VGKLTPEETVREHNRGKKPQVMVAHVIGASLGHTRSNPMNIMKNAGKRSSRAMILSFNNSAKTRVYELVSEG
jgi:hypothetical protein